MALCLTLTLLPTAALAAETRTVSSSEELSAAIESANEGDTIQLQTSFSVTGGVTIPAGKTLTLDLNGNTLTAQVVVLGDLTIEDSTMTEGPLISEDGKYTVTYANSGKITSAYTTVDAQRGGTVTLESGMVESTGNIALFATGNSMPGGNAINSTVNINGGYVFAREFGASPQGNGATININGGVIEAQDNAVIGGNGTNTTTNNLGGYTINMTGGTLIGRIETGGYVSCGIYHPNDGTVNVSGGTIVSTNGAGIVARAGRTNITGGTIIALGDSATKGKVGDSRVVVTTSGVVLDLEAGYPGAGIENGKATNAQVNISGDPDISGNASAVSVLATSTVTEDDNVIITGGTFTSNGTKSAIDSKYFPTGTSLTQNESGKIIADEKTTVAEVNGVPYSSLEAAIEAAPAGATVTLVADAVLDADGKNDSEGALTITKDIILDGGNYTITAKNVTLDEEKGPSMINVQGNAKVTIKNVTINGKASGEGSNATKHGINIYGADVTLQNVEVQNNRWYAVVNNGGNLTVNGLTTTGNQWGINMDNRASASSLNITTASISEASSIVFDKTKETQVTATISGGNYQYIVMNSEDAKANTSLTISGGTYGTGSISNSVNIADYLAPGLSWNPSTGAVYDPSQNRPSSGSSGSSSDPSYSPILDVSDGGSIKVNPRTPEEDDEVTITVDPDSGYEVDEVTVTDRNGREVKVTAERDGTYTFTQPRGRVTISVTFVREGGSTFFSDVPESFWAYDEIAWAYDNGYVNGTSASSFSPNASISRQQVWMILARLSGADPANMSAAREWAVTNGVSDGTTPGGAVTRQQLVALLYRYATLMGYANDQRADLSAYPDAGTVAGYAVEPMQWSVANSIVGGTSNGTLDPTGTATRAEVAAILMRFVEQNA